MINILFIESSVQEGQGVWVPSKKCKSPILRETLLDILIKVQQLPDWKSSKQLKCAYTKSEEIILSDSTLTLLDCLCYSFSFQKVLEKRKCKYLAGFYPC